MHFVFLVLLQATSKRKAQQAKDTTSSNADSYDNVPSDDTLNNYGASPSGSDLRSGFGVGGSVNNNADTNKTRMRQDATVKREPRCSSLSEAMEHNESNSSSPLLRGRTPLDDDADAGIVDDMEEGEDTHEHAHRVHNVMKDVERVGCANIAKMGGASDSRGRESAKTIEFVPKVEHTEVQALTVPPDAQNGVSTACARSSMHAELSSYLLPPLHSFTDAYTSHSGAAACTFSTRSDTGMMALPNFPAPQHTHCLTNNTSRRSQSSPRKVEELNNDFKSPVLHHDHLGLPLRDGDLTMQDLTRPVWPNDNVSISPKSNQTSYGPSTGHLRRQDSLSSTGNCSTGSLEQRGLQHSPTSEYIPGDPFTESNTSSSHAPVLQPRPTHHFTTSTAGRTMSKHMLHKIPELQLTSMPCIQTPSPEVVIRPHSALANPTSSNLKLDRSSSSLPARPRSASDGLFTSVSRTESGSDGPFTCMSRTESGGDDPFTSVSRAEVDDTNMNVTTPRDVPLNASVQKNRRSRRYRHRATKNAGSAEDLTAHPTSVGSGEIQTGAVNYNERVHRFVSENDATTHLDVEPLPSEHQNPSQFDIDGISDTFDSDIAMSDLPLRPLPIPLPPQEPGLHHAPGPGDTGALPNMASFGLPNTFPLEPISAQVTRAMQMQMHGNADQRVTSSFPSAHSILKAAHSAYGNLLPPLTLNAHESSSVDVRVCTDAADTPSDTSRNSCEMSIPERSTPQSARTRERRRRRPRSRISTMKRRSGVFSRKNSGEQMLASNITGASAATSTTPRGDHHHDDMRDSRSACVSPVRPRYPLPGAPVPKHEESFMSDELERDWELGPRSSGGMDDDVMRLPPFDEDEWLSGLSLTHSHNKAPVSSTQHF